MDLYCCKCGEPVEHDMLHDVAKATGNTYAEVASDYRVNGCTALGMTHNRPREDRDEVFNLTPQEASAALYDMLGDDMDGAAAMMEDMGF